MTLVFISIAIALLIITIVVGIKYNNEQKINKAVESIHPFYNYEWSQDHFINPIEHLAKRNTVWSKQEQIMQTGNNAGKKVITHTKILDNLKFITIVVDGLLRDGIIVCSVEDNLPLNTTVKFNFIDGTSYTTLNNRSVILYEDIDLFMHSPVVSYELNGIVTAFPAGDYLIEALKLTNF